MELKIAFFIIVAGVSNVLANPGYSQVAKVSLDMENKSLEQVMDEIERQSEFYFIFNQKQIDVNRIVDIQVENELITDILPELFKGTDVNYVVLDRKILLTTDPLENNLLTIASDAELQQVTLRGTVTDAITGDALPGVNVIVTGTTLGTMTDIAGKYSIEVPPGSKSLTFSFIGMVSQEIIIGTLTQVDVTMTELAIGLEEVVVIGYGTTRKKDIVGAVAVVEISNLKSTPSSSVISQIQGRASGVAVSSTGDPGSSSNIRIRGFSSYGNSNPLYVIDGIASTETPNLNPQDIASLQILKDASSASIYGARAANGVILITTKQGQSGKTTFTYDMYTGFQRLPYNKIPKMLNTEETMQYLQKTSQPGYVDPIYGSYGSFSIPEMYVVSNKFKGGVSASDPRTNPDLYSILDYGNIYQIFKTSPGTDWFREMSRDAIIQSHQISASGGTDKSTYSFGLNYFNQEGVFKYVDYDRYTIRMNSSFKATNFLTIGENVQVSYVKRMGTGTVMGEETAWANSYRSAPFVPVYDIKGGWGGSLIGGTAGNAKNPLATLYRQKDVNDTNLGVFGNVFVEVKLLEGLTIKSLYGIDASSGYSRNPVLPEYEKTERTTTTSLSEGADVIYDWTWSNTMNYQKTLGDHSIKVLVGMEAIHNYGKSLRASISNFDFTNDDFMLLNTGLPVTLSDISVRNPILYSYGILSYFGRIDYILKDKYIFNVTDRIDGSSVFGKSERYGNFPSVGLGWRISGESFMKSLTWLTDMKLRLGWGRMGSISNVPGTNQYSFFSSNQKSFYYDMGGTNQGSQQGFGLSALGNPDTKWETTESSNLGLDVNILNGKWNLVADIYLKDTKDLLVPSFRNSLAPDVVMPYINLGKMRNKGFDLQLTNRGTITGDLSYDINLTFSHYKNEVTKLNDENTPLIVSASRLFNILYTTKGEAISSFYGYQIDGFYNNTDDIASGPTINGTPGNIGTWKFKDMNGDNNITTEDRIVLGTPHPDFQMGLNLGLNWKNFDFLAFLFWNQGNEIFNYNKYFIYMGVLGGGVASGKLYDAWTPETASTAKTPQLGIGVNNGYTSFVTNNSTSFYVEDGSYLRLKTLQLGYNLPASLIRKISIGKLRIYVQGQNLFTLTKYTGADPDLGLISGTNTDQFLGVDLSGYPNTRQFLVGINLSF